MGNKILLIIGVLLLLTAIIYFVAGHAEKTRSGAYGGNVAVGLFLLIAALANVSGYRVESSEVLTVTQVVQYGDLYEVTLPDGSTVSTREVLNTSSDDWSLTKNTVTALFGLNPVDTYVLNIPAVAVTIYESEVDIVE